MLNRMDAIVCKEHYLLPIDDLLHTSEAPLRARLEASGDMGGLLYNYVLFIDSSLPETEHVGLCYFMESHVLTVAQQGEFNKVITNNSNPVTQVCIQSV